MNSFAERCEPFDRLVAEDKTDVPFGNRIAPAAHRRGRDLLLKQASRDVHTIEAQRGDIEEQGPASGGLDDGQPVELP
jgi:hypothetical protein